MPSGRRSLTRGSQVSKLCKDIDERVQAFLERPLEGEWPYLWLDATYLKVREGGRIVPVAAIIAVAVSSDGRREIIGLGLGPSEAETFRSTFLKGLVRRGLKEVKLVISDAHDGLKQAAAKVLKATWQRCRVHWMRNALAHVAKGQHTMVAAGPAPSLSAGRPAGRPADLAAGRRPATATLAQARRPHGRQRARRAGLPGVPGATPHQASLHKPVGALGIDPAPNVGPSIREIRHCRIAPAG